MSKQKRINRMLDKLGLNALIVTNGEQVNVRCIIQPMRYKNKIYVDSQYTKLGIVDESSFLYIGPAEYPLAEGTDEAVIIDKTTSYNCVKTEMIYLGNEKAYTWAILRLRR